jgi:putative transposase
MNNRKAYSTDLNDYEWQLIEPLLPAPKTRGRKIEDSRREILNAIFYQVGNGCGWRNLPHALPPYGVVSYYYHLWRKDHTWQAINDILPNQLRRAHRRNSQPTAGILDSQNVKTTEVGGERGFDAGKLAAKFDRKKINHQLAALSLSQSKAVSQP